MPGLTLLDPDWEICALRFAKALVHTATKELYACFGPGWGGSVKDYHALTGGITAVGVTFYTFDRLEAYFDRIPDAREDPQFGELQRKHIPGTCELVCAAWPAVFAMHH